jgi:hypothetical protein
MPNNQPTAIVARELARLGYVVNGDEQYTIQGDPRPGTVYVLVGIQEEGAAHGVVIRCLMRPVGEPESYGAHPVNIGRVSKVESEAVA